MGVLEHFAAPPPGNIFWSVRVLTYFEPKIYKTFEIYQFLMYNFYNKLI